MGSDDKFFAAFPFPPAPPQQLSGPHRHINSNLVKALHQEVGQHYQVGIEQ